MKLQKTIAGIFIDISFCNKVNAQPINLKNTSKEPLVNIYEIDNKGIYTVNILSHVPQNLNQINDIDVESGLFLNEDKTLVLNYGGISSIETSVTNDSTNGKLPSRSFDIDYNCPDKDYQNFDLYHIQFNYRMTSANAQSAEAIIIHDVNLDPETDRGTVATIRRGKR